MDTFMDVSLPLEIIAIILGHADMVNIPINKKYSRNYHYLTLTHSPHNKKIFTNACIQGKIEYVKLLSTQLIDTLSELDFNEGFLFSVVYNHLDVVKYLSTFPKVDVTFDKNKAMRYVSCVGHLEIIKYLVSCKGVDVTTCNNYPIRTACIGGHYEVVKYLSTLPGVNPADYYNEAIKTAYLMGHISIYKFLKAFPGVHL